MAKFCDACHNVLKLIKLHPQHGSGHHHKSYQAFQEAVAGGCCVCKRYEREHQGPFRDRVTAFSMSYTYQWETNKKEDFESGLPANTVAVLLARDDADATDLEEREYWSIPRLRLNLVPELPHERTTKIKHIDTRNTGSKQCLALASLWLETCVGKHATCDRPRPEALRNWKPNRLVYVGLQDHDGLRLCEAGAIPTGVKYTTLSHCWGKQLERRPLMQQNLAKWTEAIPDDVIKPTFKDAIKVTRSLGIQYMWIDSLCIIQDSRADWLHESSHMSKIYKYSYCSIAATAAEDDAAGCFRDRDPLLDLPVQIDFSSIAADPIGKVAKDERRDTIEGTYYMQWERTWFFEIGFSPLIDRAWVVQERLLAPRVLHFAKTQLYWECNELRACESYPNEMPKEQYTKVDYKTIFPFSESVKQNISDLQEQRQRKQNFAAWGVIVQGYSQAKLTQEGDKLIAISAIAREMKLLMQCKYLAGHWETDLVRQLGWPGYDINSRPTTYRAPSWSWASVDGRNQFWYNMYSYDHSHPLAEVLATHIDLAGEDEMGPVTGGYLDILSQLFELEVREENEEEKRRRPRRSGRPILIQGQATDIRFHQDGPESGLDGPLYFMPLSLSFSTKYEELEINGLALQQLYQQDMYRRVGSVESGIGDQLQKNDPILKILGEIEWGEKFEFRRNRSNLKTVRIV